jgi:chromate reductase, NAD(P)H dehydrogenase (quinone)
MKICILPGSSRKNSNTAKVAKGIKRIVMDNGVSDENIFIPDFTLYDIPFSNGQPMIEGSLSDFQQAVYAGMSNADIVFFLSPEYNWFPSAEIINIVHVFGSKEYKECWSNKLFATCGISNGRGGRIPAVQLSYVINKLINVMDLQSVVSAKMFESQFTNKVLDENGHSLGHEEYDHGLIQFVNYNLNMAKKVLGNV